MRLTTLFTVAGLSVTSLVRASPIQPRSELDPDAWDDLHRAAQLSSAAYTGCLGSAFDITITKQIRGLISDTQGFVGYSTSRKTIAVVMRGSTSITDILNDIDTLLVTPTLSGVSFPPDAKIMNGLYRPWSSVHDDVLDAVRALITKFPDYTLESTGHSLGGALTYMSYVALAANFPGKNIRSMALAAFPIGNEAFAEFGMGLRGVLVRGDNVGDGVPNMYVSLPYNFKHFGTEYYSAGLKATTRKCDGDRDLQCSAGNLAVGVTPGHFSSFGVGLGSAGCGGIV